MLPVQSVVVKVLLVMGLILLLFGDCAQQAQEEVVQGYKQQEEKVGELTLLQSKRKKNNYKSNR